MKTKTRLLTLTAALVLTASAAPAAWALQTEWVATGTVSNGSDSAGVFGLAGGSLDGDSFTADFYIDTSKGIESVSPGYSDEVEGGSYEGYSSPVSATLTINGIIQVFDGVYAGGAYTQSDEGYGGSLSVSSSIDDGDFIYIESSGQSSGFSSMIGQAFSVSNVEEMDGAFQLTRYNGGDASNYGYLAFDTIASVGVSAAPEPSTWTLLIAGVGLVGAALRVGRRRGWAVAA